MRPNAEPERHRDARHVGRLPEREAIATEEDDRPERRADEAAVVRQPARPELRPREAVGLLRVAERRRRVPRAVVRGDSALAAVDGQSTSYGLVQRCT